MQQELLNIQIEQVDNAIIITALSNRLLPIISYRNGSLKLKVGIVVIQLLQSNCCSYIKLRYL